MSDIKSAVQNLSKTNTGFDALIELATVIAVNESEMTCDVVLFDNDELILEGVKLKPVVPELDITEMGAVAFPEINSKVLIAQINNDPTDLFVVSVTKVKKISLDAGSLLKLAMDLQSGSMGLDLAKGLIFNGGKNGGLPKVKPLLEKINRLEKMLNDLVTAFNNHTHAGVASGGGTTAQTLTKAVKIENQTVIGDIENKDIQQ